MGDGLVADLFALWLRLLPLDLMAAFLLSVTVPLAVAFSVFVLRFEGGGHLIFLMLLFLVCTGVMLANSNVAVFYLAWELAALLAWAIGQLDAEPTGAIAALPMQMAGAVASMLMIISLAALASAAGTLDLAPLRGDGLEWVGPTLLAALLLKSLALVGYAWREGRQRLSWATGAFHVTGGVFLIGLYPYSRLLIGVFGDMSHWYWRESAVWLGLVGALVCALAALGEDDTKRVASYGALSQLLVFVAALALPSARGLAGALLMIIVYAAAIAAVFLSLGLVEGATGERRLSRLGGLAAAMPGTASVFLLAALCLVGLPPVGAFLGQTLLVSTLLQLHSFWPAVLYGLIWALTLLYLLRLFRGVFLGAPNQATTTRHSLAAVLGLASVAALLLAFGLLPFWTSGAVEPIVGQLMK